MLPLSPRLKLIADMVPFGARVYDIGSDHAYVPIYLALRGKIKSAVASDINVPPVERAKRNIARWGVGDIVTAQKSDGLTLLPPGGADAVIISGMGGRTIGEILEKGPLMGNELLILQPMTEAEFLRAFLSDNGFSIIDEELVEEGGRIYVIILSQKGGGERYTPLQLLIGPRLIEKGGPLFHEYAGRHIKRIGDILASLQKSARGREREKQQYESLLEGLLRLIN